MILISVEAVFYPFLVKKGSLLRRRFKNMYEIKEIQYYLELF